MVDNDYVVPYEKIVSNRTEVFLKHLLAGAVAGGISKTLTAPLDRVKIFYQVNKSKENMIITIKHMIQEGGIRSLWRGNWINVLKTAPKSSIRFAFYDQIKKIYRGNDSNVDDLVYHERLIAGSIAGGISQTLTFPLEVLKVKISLATTGQYKGIIDAIRKTYKTEGIRAFGKGYVPTLISIVPSAGMEISLYETLKKFIMDRKNRDLNNYEVFFTSSASCLVGQIITYPLNLVSTILQATTYNPSIRSVGMMEVTDGIIKTKGYKGLYRGLWPHLLKFMPVSGIMFLTYELIIKELGVNMEYVNRKL